MATAVVKIKPLTPSERKALAEWAQSELAKQDLIEFCKTIDPKAADRYSAPHLIRMAEELEKVESGEIPRLFITAPPRHWKSSLVSEKFPLWYLAKHPDKSVGVFSHGAALPTRFSKSVKGNIDSNPRFHKLFPEIKLRIGSENSSDWSLLTAFRSSFRAFGVGTGPTGEGFDLISVDDPVADAAEAYSPTALERIWTWYKETLRDRLNPGGVICVVMSRWHENDLAGRIMRESRDGTGEQWNELRLPAIAEQGDLLGRKPGEALWPAEWPLEALMQVKLAQGSRVFAARFQGSPKAMEGNLLDSTKLKMIDASELPPMVQIVRRWDLAFSENKGADYSAGVKMGKSTDGRKFILHVKRVHGRWLQVEPAIKLLANTDGVDCICMVETNGQQGGYYDIIKRDVPNRTVEEDCVQGSKEMRASMWGTRLPDGIIYCVRGEWNQELFDEMDYFPNGENDDMVDGVSGAWQRLNEGTGGMQSNRSAVYENRVAGVRGQSMW